MVRLGLPPAFTGSIDYTDFEVIQSLSELRRGTRGSEGVVFAPYSLLVPERADDLLGHHPTLCLAGGA